MKKGIILASLLAGLMLVSCGDKSATKNGSYSEESYGTQYNTMVTVKLDANQVIESVTIDDGSNIATPDTVWPKPSNYQTELNDLLESFKGRTAEQVLAIQLDEEKLPYITTVDMMSGATITSVRIIKAVQDSLKDYIKKAPEAEEETK